MGYANENSICSIDPLPLEQFCAGPVLVPSQYPILPLLVSGGLVLVAQNLQWPNIPQLTSASFP